MTDGKVWAKSAGGRGDGEVLKRFVEFDNIGWGDASQREVGRGDGGLLSSAVLEVHFR